MIGIDIVVISRIGRVFDRFGKKFLDRFLDESEQKLVNNKQTMAGFYAAKEAVSKALGVGIGSEFSFHDVKIYKTDSNAPKLKLDESIKNKFNIDEISLSISHDGGFSIAAVIIKKL